MPRLSFSSNGGGGGGDTSDSGHLTLGTRFTCKAAGGKLVGYRFRYPWGGVTAPDNVGTFGLYDAVFQTQVANSVVSGVTLKKGDSYNGGWYTIDLPTPIDLVQNKEYVATVFMPDVMRSMSRPALNGTTQPDRGYLDHLGCRYVVNGSAAMAWPSNTSSAYYLIEPVVLVGNKSTFTGVEGSWDFNYADSAALQAAGWSFATPNAVNTESGTAAYSSGGLTITPNSSGTSDVLHRQLPSDWTSLVVKMVANPQNVAGRYVRFGLVNQTETMYLGMQEGGVPTNGGSSPYDQTSGPWYMNDRGYNTGNLANMGAGIPRWLRIDRDIETELLTYMFSLNGLDWLIPVYGHTQNDIDLATKIPHNIDANTLFISGASPNSWTYQIQNISVQGIPDPLPVAQGEMKLPDGRLVKKIYTGTGQQIGAGYRNGTWFFQPTMDGEYVEFDVTGPSFRPKIGLVEGSTAQCLWTLDDDKVFVDGLNPNIDFKLSAERKVRLYVRNGNVPAFDEVAILNLGYDNTEDSGFYGPGPAHNYPPQSVTSITNLLALTNLQMLMAAHSTLLHVPFTGMANLLYIELFHAEVQEVDLTGCNALVRLCLEQTRVPQVDLNPVKSTLKDLRYAAIRGLSAPAGLAALTGTMSQLYHYCIRNNQGFTGNLTFDQLPVIEERWDWECGFSGIAGTIPNTLRSYDTHGNPYTSAEMDEIYMGLDAAGRTNGFLMIQAGEQIPAAPGSSGAAARANLIAKGWTITS